MRTQPGKYLSCFRFISMAIVMGMPCGSADMRSHLLVKMAGLKGEKRNSRIVPAHKESALKKGRSKEILKKRTA